VIIWIAIIVGLAIGLHLGAGQAHYRHARASGRSRKSSLFIGSRGVWASVPVGGGFRIGHRL